MKKAARKLGEKRECALSLLLPTGMIMRRKSRTPIVLGDTMIDGMKECEYVGGLIFDKIKTDHRVTPDLVYCLYCKVTTNENNSIRDIPYKITLDCINGNVFKQCPACKRIYILKDPTE